MNIYKSKIIVLIICVFCNLCFAGRDPIYKISLAREKINLESKTFKILEVIDNRSSKYLIGNVQIGISNALFVANFEKSLKEEFTNLLLESNILSPNQDSLILIINSLWICEQTSAVSEKGLADLNFYIAKKQFDNFLIISEQDITIYEGTFDATASHDKRIAKALQKGFDNFLKTPKDSLSNIPLQINDKKGDTLVFRCKNILKGVHRTINDLINNFPDKNLSFKNTYPTEKNMFVLDAIPKKELKKIFSFTDGEYLYVNSHIIGNYSPKTSDGYQFTKTKIKGKGPILFVEDEFSNINEQIMYVYSMGLIGLALAATVKTRVVYTLDLRNGAFFPLDKRFMEMLIKDSPEVYKEYKSLSFDEKKDVSILKKLIKKYNELYLKNI
jgi:hypothetical protein